MAIERFELERVLDRRSHKRDTVRLAALAPIALGGAVAAIILYGSLFAPSLLLSGPLAVATVFSGGLTAYLMINGGLLVRHMSAPRPTWLELRLEGLVLGYPRGRSKLIKWTELSRADRKVGLTRSGSEDSSSTEFRLQLRPASAAAVFMFNWPDPAEVLLTQEAYSRVRAAVQAAGFAWTHTPSFASTSGEVLVLVPAPATRQRAD
jgi:hypothetical protein